MKIQQNRFKPWLFLPAVILVALGVGWLFGHGVTHAQASNTLRVVGALDMQPLVSAVKDDFLASWQMNLEFVPSQSTLSDLRDGKADFALLGREPTLAELGEFEDHLVALDAVCMLINQRTNNGGVKDAYIQGSANTNGQPVVRYVGLKNLSLDDLRGLMGRNLGFNNNIWVFQGDQAVFYSFEPYVDLNNQPVPDPDHPGWFSGQWVFTSVDINGEMLTPGMFDTQASLLQRLGLPESVLRETNSGFINPIYDSEELLISRSFGVDPGQDKQESTIPFEYRVEIASRRIAIRALEHKFALRAISIDNVDPLSDPSVIYSGSYPLTRGIHLLIRKPVTKEGNALADYLVTAGAQKLISDADYLPVHPIP